MRLTRLELHGFKSFADQTALTFNDGVTAIVGPNGCGKSNVSDAVRWVLGEQRARILRGAKMEEVIFQGSSARHAVNVAEVSLVFENDAGLLPVPFREVVVSRRLSRSGESEYLLNGTACRLRDIHDLMRGTGLGADAGVVIEAKMIDALLSDRPDDRRELFEEAAGVSLYRDRRRSTERRLEETAQDLARLDDLLNEVQTQVRSLSRQRKKAERHAELTTRRFGVELTLAAREMESWHEELGALEGRLVTLREASPRGASRVREAESARDGAHDARSVAEAARNELVRLVNAHAKGVQELRAEIAVADERHRNAAAQRQRAVDEQREGLAYDERLRAERARAAEERERLAQEGLAVSRELGELLTREDTARQTVAAARGAVEAADRSARTLREQLSSRELDRDRAERESSDIVLRQGQLDSEHSQLADAATVLHREVAAAEEHQALARARATAAQQALDAARARAHVARDTDAASRAKLARVEDQWTQLEARVNALEALERERVGLAPAAARLLRERDRFGAEAILGPLSDFVTTSADSASRVERFLGMTIHAVVVRDGAVAEAVREWHAAANPGPLLLLPLDALESDVASHGELLDQVQPAAPVVGWVRTLLSKARVLSDGAFVDARGAVWLPGTLAGPGPLRRRAELFSLRSELNAAQDARARMATGGEQLRLALTAAEGETARAADALAIALQEDRQANEQRTEVERRKVRAEREREEAATLAQRLGTRRSELGNILSDIERLARELTGQMADQELASASRRDALAAAELALEGAREQRTHAQVAQAQAEARTQVAADRGHRLQEESDTAVARLTLLHTELESIDAADQALAAQMSEWQAAMGTRVATLADAEARLAEGESAVRDADAALTGVEHALDAARRLTHDESEALHHAELRFTELSGRRAAIRERLETEWRRSLDDLLATFDPVALDDDSLRAEADALRAEVERLGPVNPLAIEEHSEEVKRLDFLTTQRNDLADARTKLQLAIREIDVTARDLFLGTFAQVRENFRHIFMLLFGGGECDLRLENPDAPLDCDIEIHASPRGKRTQRIHLLSSGERALVALSLLFGLFLTKPSPFCLLDEVDAPLDDANIGRFVRMLNEFKAKTQFIVITHNPRTTTEAADAVYGVTMQEPGVSSVVSVRMRGAPVDPPVPDEIVEGLADVAPRVTRVAPASLEETAAPA